MRSARARLQWFVVSSLHTYLGQPQSGTAAAFFQAHDGPFWDSLFFSSCSVFFKAGKEEKWTDLKKDLARWDVVWVPSYAKGCEAPKVCAVEKVSWPNADKVSSDIDWLPPVGTGKCIKEPRSSEEEQEKPCDGDTYSFKDKLNGKTRTMCFANGQLDVEVETGTGRRLNQTFTGPRSGNFKYGVSGSRTAQVTWHFKGKL
ncbi:unnamed protein product [Vitrella brassicaformis CCMP3155]|uniref:Uncharacterized protein n=1 Tax=Vitrella brassicaformis (strain CCMP3155) TaxID=1169540 RepID=A0A0G4EQ07_VITBC|nr:unnamed protein product [Vitrella brassicaformis CCMP3155]|eukprot:CEL99482.1 unnamed protein product [Vitrella brassicaformis CCMP3155]